ncbi:MAG: hypothetical protein KC457_33800, partial [Myxococcales bacterium]|nr:hypothetical protein [Myxococcales bacterium]
EPMFDTRSAIRLLAWWATGNQMPSYDLVYGHWQAELGASFSKRRWERWLHDGIVTGVPRSPSTPVFQHFDALASAIKNGLKDAPQDELFEVNFHLDPKLADGRYANNGWMQEVPHPMSKLCWDNAAYISPATAKELKAENCDLLNIQIPEVGEIQVPVWVMPGQADKTVSLNIGYGREKLGQIAEGCGVDVSKIQRGENPWFAGNAGVSKTSGQRMIYSTQDHGTLDPGLGYPERPIVRETTTTEGGWAEPDFAKQGDLMKAEDLRSLWEHNEEATLGEPKLIGKQQWGMVIDLNRCNGCNACVAACNAENNIPIVGRKEVGNGREMHWMRIDRYEEGDADNPTVHHQPMLCQHCDN